MDYPVAATFSHPTWLPVVWGRNNLHPAVRLDRTHLYIRVITGVRIPLDEIDSVTLAVGWINARVTIRHRRWCYIAAFTTTGMAELLLRDIEACKAGGHPTGEPG